MLPLPRAALPCLAVVALGGCAAEPQAMAGMGVMVKLAQPSADPTAIAAMVGAAGGRPARHQSSSSTAWHSLAIGCHGAADCDAVLQRLRADTGRFEAVQRDERKRIVSP